MKVYELISKLTEAPAGAEVFVETIKSVEELLANNASENEDTVEISFTAKGIKGCLNEVVIYF